MAHFRLLESGDKRLIETGDKRLLEFSGSPHQGVVAVTEVAADNPNGFMAVSESTEDAAGVVPIRYADPTDEQAVPIRVVDAGPNVTPAIWKW